ncbi:C2H2 zinc finger protein [Pelomyxa schiedti]|nr:C2H2 zinc finger protein [Pelomyxa schiedti]
MSGYGYGYPLRLLPPVAATTRSLWRAAPAAAAAGPAPPAAAAPSLSPPTTTRGVLLHPSPSSSSSFFYLHRVPKNIYNHDHATVPGVALALAVAPARSHPCRHHRGLARPGGLPPLFPAPASLDASLSVSPAHALAHALGHGHGHGAALYLDLRDHQHEHQHQHEHEHEDAGHAHVVGPDGLLEALARTLYSDGNNKPSGTCMFGTCQEPVWIDANGEPSQFCSRRHRDSFTKVREKTPSRASMHCIFPGCSNRCWVDPISMVPSQFCSRRHRDEYKEDYCSDEDEDDTPGNSFTTDRVCRFPNCPKHCYVDPCGIVSDFCSRSHRDAMQETGRVEFLAPTSAEYKSVIAQFALKWEKEGQPLHVISISKVYPPSWIFSRYMSYRDRIIPLGSWETPGNEKRRFHGTCILCDLGIKKSNSTPCAQPACSICGIIRNGFKVGMTPPEARAFQRFGMGLYFTSTSGKANDYSSPSERRTQSGGLRRAMLLCKVIVGNPHLTKVNAPALAGPPPGCHSVVGQTGVDLNYDEVVIYDERAAIPAYLLWYTIPPDDQQDS